MLLAPGVRVGVYEVVAAIGQGGMGEVYRARDTKLDRDVAIKILPEVFAHDPDRVARFQREAKTLAALNHPNIGGIYGVEEGPAESGHHVRALVLELVEGPTLADRIAQGATPIAEAFSIARQIAEALSAAHEQGIVHRDLKPANIKLRDDGTVKVLDFGLAKVLEPGGGGSAVESPALLTASPTLSVMATQAGVILGTAPYMAPEQAKGKPADKRCDIWAFGCVLYEMLTGRRAFDGDDVTETLAAVVLREPDWSRLPGDVPPAIRTLLRRSLEKDRRKRLADISTALVLIDEAPGLATPPGPATPGSLVRPSRVALVAAASGVIVATIAVPATWWMTRPAPPRVLRTEITTSGAAALSIQGTDRDIAITPDGSRVVYRGTTQLFVRALDQIEPEVLSGLGAPRGVFVSPDSQWVGFFDGLSMLKKVAIIGGPPLTITTVDGPGPRGATWGPDGTIVYATDAPATGLQRVSAAGGDPTVLTTPKGERGEADHLWPEFMPGGEAVLFTITAVAGGSDNAQIAVLDLNSGMSKTLVRGGHHAHYVPSGHLVYGAGGTLRAVAFDPDRLEVVGTPVPVLEQIATTGAGAVDVSVTVTGTLVYVPGRGGGARSLVWVDRMGSEALVPAPPRPYFYLRLSPDGTRVAVDVRDQELDIWIWDFTRETLTRFTFDPAEDQYPVWSPDSRRLLFASQRAGIPSLFWQAADGTGAVERLTEATNAQVPLTMTPDGSRVVFREDAPQQDLMLLPMQPPRRPQRLIQTMFAERNAELAPDGRWLAYESNESGREEIYVRPFPDVSGGRWQVSTGGGRTPLWSRNGQELFYVSPDSALMGVRLEPGPSWRSSTPARILQGQYFYGVTGRSFDIAPDGRRFLMVKQGTGSEAAPRNLVVVQNWTEELKRLVPTN